MLNVSMNQGWELHEEPLNVLPRDLALVKRESEGWYPCSLPVDVRMPLIRERRIKDPVKSDYALESEWIEKRSWWFRKEFTVTPELMESDIIELFIERLDSHADIFVNDFYAGSHESVHYPFIYNVKDFLHEGTNIIYVRVTTGLEAVTDAELAEINYAVCTEYDNGGKYRGDKRRAFVRRPAYTIGWDWNPKIVTCGITGKAELTGYTSTAIREVHLTTISADAAKAIVHATVNIENLDIIGSKDCSISIKLIKDGKNVCEIDEDDVLLTSGYNYYEKDLTIDSPELWWPHGYGEQPMYDVSVTVTAENHTETYRPFKYAIRTLRLLTDRISGTSGRRFTFVVNGTPIFAKGGDWVPADSIYARVTDEKVDALLQEGLNANFNFLRIWGGGVFETDHFYNRCDEYGILIWHDFMFACTTYPDHQEWFRQIVTKELDYQTKRLRNHACIAVFCGSNEDHWLFNSIDTPKWNIQITHNKQYGLYVQNVISREIVKNNCPEIPYWNCSPYGGKLPNSEDVGDMHIWRDQFMSSKMDERLDVFSYDRVHSKFVTEYGYVGPCCRKSIEEYLDVPEGSSIQRFGRPWEMHLNVFEKGTIAAGIDRFYRDYSSDMSLDDYILYGGMVQSFVYQYSLEAIRFQLDCSGAIFWMYNDAWGEAGWTIIDYYLRRKPSYYGVKRAFEPRKLILRKEGNQIILHGANDLGAAVDTDARCGFVSFDGSIENMVKIHVHIDPYSRASLATIPAPDYDPAKGMFAVIPDDPAISPAVLYELENRKLDYQKGTVTVRSCVQEGNNIKVTVSSNSYIHGVYVKEDYKCSDNYFDLLPGVEKTIIVENPNGNQIHFDSVR